MGGSLHTKDGIDDVIGMLQGRMEIIYEWNIKILELFGESLLPLTP
jgi:hypothetical protein